MRAVPPEPSSKIQDASNQRKSEFVIVPRWTLYLSITVFGAAVGVLLTIAGIWLIQRQNVEAWVAASATIGIFLFVGLVAWATIWLIKKVTSTHWTEPTLEAAEKVALWAGPKSNEAQVAIKEGFQTLRRTAQSLVRGMLVAAISASVVTLATASIGIAGFLLQQLQLQRLAEQNNLLRVQNDVTAIDQEFSAGLALAESRYQEIAKILLDLDSTPHAQALALESIPEAMRMAVPRVDARRMPNGSNTDAVVALEEYPNVQRLRSLLRQYMKMDRVSSRIAKSGFQMPSDNEAMPREAVAALRSLEPASTALLITLHRLGAVERVKIENGEVVPSPTNLPCLWRFDPDGLNSPPPAAPSPKSVGDPINLQHLAETDLAGLQAPWANAPKLVLRPHAKLSRSHLEGAVLIAVIAKHVDLSGARLEDSRLAVGHLNQATLFQTHFERADLSDAKFNGASAGSGRRQVNAFFGASKLQRADFSEATLQNVDFSGTESLKSIFHRAQIDHSNFDGASLVDAHFCAADLSHTSARGAAFTGAQLNGAILRGSELSGAIFRSASLLAADLSNTDLKLADFLSASLSGANLTNSFIQGAIFSGAFLHGTREERPLHPVDLDHRPLICWNFSKETVPIALPGAILNGAVAGSSQGLYIPLLSLSGDDLLLRAARTTQKISDEFLKELKSVRWLNSDSFAAFAFDSKFRSDLHTLIGPRSNEINVVERHTEVAYMEPVPQYSNNIPGPLRLGSGTNSAFIDEKTLKALKESLHAKIYSAPGAYAAAEQELNNPFLTGQSRLERRLLWSFEEEAYRAWFEKQEQQKHLNKPR